MYTLALNGWTFPRDTPPDRQCELAAAVGFAGIELTINADGNPTFETPDNYWNQLGRIAAGLNLRVTSLASGVFFQTHYASRDPADGQTAIDRTRRMLDIAALLGAGAIVVIPAVVGRATDAGMQVCYSDAMRCTFDALAKLRHDAEDRAVTIAIENVWNRFLLSPLEAADLVDRVNSPHVGWCLDTGNILSLGYPADWIRTLSRRIARVHIKDYDLSRPGRDGFCALGEGSVDWAEVMAALTEIHYEGPLIFEGPGDPAAIIERMRKLMTPNEPQEPAAP